MPESDLRQELNRISGALEVLGLLHERLQLQRNEPGAESGREAVDEMLSQVDALQTEYSAPPREPSPAQQKLPVFPDCRGRATRTRRLLCGSDPR